MALEKRLYTDEDRSCPFKPKCDPNCALYIGGDINVQGDCAFTISATKAYEIYQLLKRFYNEFKKLPN